MIILVTYGWAGLIAVLVSLDILLSSVFEGRTGILGSAARIGVAGVLALLWLYTWRLLALQYRRRLLGR